MCLRVDKEFKTRKEARDFKPTVLKKDIIVYKILNINNSSPYRGFVWEKGFHYYQDDCLRGRIYKVYASYWRLDIFVGLHAFISIDKAQSFRKDMFNPENKKIVKMTIPKGSSVFYGHKGDIVSDNMIYL